MLAPDQSSAALGIWNTRKHRSGMWEGSHGLDCGDQV